MIDIDITNIPTKTKRKKTKSQKNTRHLCKACGNKTTKNQLKITKGKCLYCDEILAVPVVIYQIKSQ